MAAEDFAGFLDKLEGYLTRWRTRGGFFRIGVAIVAALVLVAGWLGVPKPYTTVASVVAVVIWAFFWFIGSGRFVLPSNDDTVVLAFDVDPEGQRQYDRILDRIRLSISMLELSRPLRVVPAGPGVVRDLREASRYLLRFNLMMVVWGSSTSGQIAGEKVLQFDIKHTMPVIAGVQENMQHLADDLSLLNQGRDWTIKEVNDLLDMQAVAEGLLEITLAIIGIWYYLVNRTADGVSVFRIVVASEEARNGPTSQSARRYRELLDAGLAREGRAAHDRRDFAHSVEIIEELLPRYPQNIGMLMTLARSAYYAGDETKAVKHTMEIAAIDPKHPAVAANRAFFAIKHKKYAEVRRWYDRLRTARDEKYDLLPSVSAFLEERYEEDPNEHAYLYGLAIVNGFDDLAVLNNDLMEFIDRTEGTTAYEPLRRRAAQLLNRQSTIHVPPVY